MFVQVYAAAMSDWC